eukprot:gnl/Trimastix_PCT/2947.p1 GENE.gnl/Trimastix_PCT/2947~~gnl/Trimastix_PCT/2947.p1  ORF type:complete len:329 (+),score=44.59 gnl/Trimastix_PCT/2947:68-1054(+)
MHGIKKSTHVSQKNALDAKAVKYRAICARILELKASHSLEREAFTLTEKALTINPDFITIWSYRKTLLLHFLEESETSRSTLLEQEFDFTESAIQRSPKVYIVWTYRRWLLSLGPDRWEKELELCRRFLRLDCRNFHCWNHWREIADRRLTLKQRWDFVTGHIESAFRNYSAWHHRSRVFTALMHAETSEQQEEDRRLLALEAKERLKRQNPPVDVSGSDIEILQRSEIELLKHAVNTDPLCQSPWMYLLYLLRVAPDKAREISECCSELLEDAEPDEIKWPTAIRSFLFHKMRATEAPPPVGPLEQLVECDPSRAGHYRDMIAAQAQ